MNTLTFRPSYLIILLCLVMIGCAKESRRIRETPPDVIHSKPCETLYGSILSQFPEYKNNETKQAVLFDAKTEKHIILLKESEVYVSYVSEGAGFSNTFGWYAYDSAHAPASAAEIQKGVLFPNVSDRILKQGDMLQLGKDKFPAGTVIGFFLVIKGWQNGSINFDNQTLYTDSNLNPNGLQQHILYKQKDCGDLVLSFEDQAFSQGSDGDFNDIIFTVTDNRSNLEVSSVDLRRVVRM